MARRFLFRIKPRRKRYGYIPKPQALIPVRRLGTPPHNLAFLQAILCLSERVVPAEEFDGPLIPVRIVHRFASGSGIEILVTSVMQGSRLLNCANCIAGESATLRQCNRWVSPWGSKTTKLGG